MSTAKVTAKIAKLGHPEVELVRGDGYHYFVFSGDVDGVDTYECVSIMIPFFRDRAYNTWIKSGVIFAERVKAGTFDRFNTHDL